MESTRNRVMGSGWSLALIGVGSRQPRVEYKQDDRRHSKQCQDYSQTEGCWMVDETHVVWTGCYPYGAEEVVPGENSRRLAIHRCVPAWIEEVAQNEPTPTGRMGSDLNGFRIVPFDLSWQESSGRLILAGILYRTSGPNCDNRRILEVRIRSAKHVERLFISFRKYGFRDNEGARQNLLVFPYVCIR